MTTSFAPLTVAIGDLVPHAANVRSNAPETYDPENIAHLKASIAVLGLLQPLLVRVGVRARGDGAADVARVLEDLRGRGMSSGASVEEVTRDRARSSELLTAGVQNSSKYERTRPRL